MDDPVQPVAVGVTTMLATAGVLPVFKAAKGAIVPLPVAAIPIKLCELVHPKLVPETAPLNTTEVVVNPLHNTCGVTLTTVGVGLTVIGYVTVVVPQIFVTA